jgi:transcriptional antiterminator NusG
MSHLTDETSPTGPPPGPDDPQSSTPEESPGTVEVEELTPDGGRLPLGGARTAPPAPTTARDLTTPAVAVAAPVVPIDDDDEPPPDLVWYVLKVQSGREDTIRDALERRVKIQGLQRFFGRIVVPTEKITEIRNNKKRVVERKSYPGYIMVEMELNEKTWFTVRETPGVGDFVGAHGTPTKMTEAEVNKMLGQETAKDEKPPQLRIDFERGDRVKIKEGPFENFEGSVEEVNEIRGLVKVMLIIFNRPTPVDLEYWQVERI